MHSDLALLLYLAIAAMFAFAFGWLVCAIIAGRRERLDAMQLAERADVNGQQLLLVARGLRDTPAPLEHRTNLDRWAGNLEDIAVAHMECINAIGLDALHAVNPTATRHLGDFVPSRPGSNPPPPSGRKPEPPANPPSPRAMPTDDDGHPLAWSEADMQKPWGAEAAFLRNLADHGGLASELAMMLRQCAKGLAAKAAAVDGPKHGDEACDGLRYVLCQFGAGSHYRDFLLVPHADGQYVTAAKLQPFGANVVRAQLARHDASQAREGTAA